MRITGRLLLIALLGTLGSVWAAPPIEVYGHLPGVERISLSPAGERFATIAVVGEQRTLMVATVAGKVLFATHVGDTKLRQVRWVGEDHLLLTLTSTFSDPLQFLQDLELAAVVNIRISDKTSFTIFQQSPSMVQAVFGYSGWAQEDGHLYGYFGGIAYARTKTGELVLDHGYRDLYRVDLDTGKTTRVVRGSGRISSGRSDSWAIAADGAVIAHSEYEQKTGAWRLYSGEDRKKLVFEKATPFYDLDLIGQGRSPGTVLIEDRTGVDDIISEVSVADGKREDLFSQVFVDTYLSDPDTGRLLGAITKDAPYAIFFDSKLQARFDATRKAFPQLQMQVASFSRNMDRLIVKTDGGNDSGTFWLVDIASGRADPIGHAYPAIRPADVGPTSLFKYAAGDGLAIEGVLTLPPGRKAQNLPVVVMPHGGPIGVSDRLGFDWWAQAYASAGYAVFQPNYRGSSDYGVEFRQAGYGQWGRKMQTDLSDGLAALAAQGLIDPKRACIVGASYGGYAALAGVTLQHGLYRCAVAVAGPADMPSFFHWEKERHGTRSAATRYWRAVTGADKDGDEALRSISPAQFAGQADAPILLIHGKDDTVVPIEQSEKMASALKSAGKPVEFVTMKGEDHWLSREATRTEMLKAAVGFVQKHNPAN